jgi:hypothetical protein
VPIKVGPNGLIDYKEQRTSFAKFRSGLNRPVLITSPDEKPKLVCVGPDGQLTSPVDQSDSNRLRRSHLHLRNEHVRVTHHKNQSALPKKAR